MTSALESTGMDTAFSKVNKTRRKMYGSVGEEGEKEGLDDLLIATDDLLASQKPEATSLFGNTQLNEGSSVLEGDDGEENLNQEPEEGDLDQLQDDDEESKVANRDLSIAETPPQEEEETAITNDTDSEEIEEISAHVGSPHRSKRVRTPTVSNDSAASTPVKPSQVSDDDEESKNDASPEPTKDSPEIEAAAEDKLSDDDEEESSDDTPPEKEPAEASPEAEASTVEDMLPNNDESNEDAPTEGSPTEEQPAEDAPEKEAPVEPLTQTTDEQPDEDSLTASVDNLFVHADKETVTVKDIVRALEQEYDVKLAKKTKLFVRGHLKDLVTGTVKPNTAGSDEEERESDEEEENEDSEPDSEADDEEEEGSDFEEETKKKRKPSKKAKAPRKSNRRSTKPKKPSATRIHAEMLRKKRMEELRVRQEELQVQQNKEDQVRAEQIAARFDTNTDELRMKRIEDRLDLLQKLDQKRIQVIHGKEALVAKKEPSDEKGIPAAASTSDSDSDSDMELEIVGGETKKEAPLPAALKRGSAQSKALAIFNRIGRGQMQTAKNPVAKKKISWAEVGGTAQSSPGKSLSARAALRSTLLSKQRKMGNLWLARELGYKSEQDHLRDCLQVEQQKRKIVIKQEEARLKANERKVLRERMLIANDEEEVVGDNEVEEKKEEENVNQEDQGDVEEDEELALAKELSNDTKEGEEDSAMHPEAPTANDSGSVQQNDNEEDDSKTVDIDGEDDDDGEMTVAFGNGNDDDDDDGDQTVAFGKPDDGDDATVGFSVNDNKDASTSPVESVEVALNGASGTEDPGIPTTIHGPIDEPLTDALKQVDEEEAKEGEVSVAAEKPSEELESEEAEAVFEDSETEEKEPSPEKPKKAKNAGWKEMLLKDAEKSRKLKKRKGNGLVEAEADEEEEEDVVAGLEDFGFSLAKQKKDDENDGEDDELDEDDLKHVVDDLSDDEGDEEAGELARKELLKREEKEQHKEMLRRMREGYDGRRGGIAGGGAGARGLHRFDQLVAADNRKDAKRLGLLNDDELDSDNDDGDDKSQSGKDASGEIEDETALLDKMLKDRFLHRSSVEVEENFSEDEEDDEGNDETNKGAQDDADAEEKEQELLAKRFAKRARMQRLIETHGQDEEFSQLRLIDEDQSMKQELMSMKQIVGAGKRQISTSSASRSSFSNAASDSQLGSFSAGNSQSLFATQSGSLTLALKASRKRKNKTSFLGGSAANKDRASAVHKSVALSHVVFHTDNSQSKSATTTTTAATLMQSKRKRTVATSSSLWDKVAANSFRKKARGY